MMIRPAIGDLLQKVGTEERAGTRYALVIAAAKRARKLNETQAEIKGKAANYVTMAINEINAGEVRVIPDSHEN